MILSPKSPAAAKLTKLFFGDEFADLPASFSVTGKSTNA
jgi:hypothetical protein